MGFTLPSADSLPRRLPRAAQQVVDVPDGSAIAAGIVKLGNAASTVGNVLMQGEERDRQKEDQLNATTATVNLSKGIMTAKDVTTTDGDYQTWGSRYETSTKALRDEEAKRIADPDLRKKFLVTSELQIANGANLVGDQARARAKSERLAGLNTVIDDAAKVAVDTGEKVDHAAMVRNVQSTIKGYVDRGDLTPLEAQEREQRFASSYAFNRRAASYKLDPLEKATPQLGYTPPAGDASTTPQTRQMLTGVLAKDKDAAQHVDQMKPRFANSLASLFESAPPEIRAGLGILSGARSRQRQQELWDKSDKTGRTVGSPDGSRHVHGVAADLAWNGKRLDSAPDEVKAWVRENAPKHGLGLPMSYEPWHIEDYEARPADSLYGANVRKSVAGARPDLMAASSVNRAKQFPAVAPQEFFGADVNVASLPAGMRNNNPGNIKYVKGSALPGITGPSQNTDQGDPQAVFSSPQAGMTAAAQLALKKFDGGRTTINALIADNGGWTPGNRGAAANIAKTMGLAPDQPVNLRDQQQMSGFLRALVTQEHGQDGARYDDKLISEASSAALGGEPVRFAPGSGGQSGGARQQQGQQAEPEVFDTDRFLTPTQRLQLDSMREAAGREARTAMRAAIADAVENAPAAIENGGSYTGDMPSRGDFIEAYGEAEGEKKAAAFEASVDVARTASGFQSATNAEIAQAIESASPAGSTGNSAALDQKRYETLQRAGSNVMKARQADPAAYVMQSLPTVRAAWDVADQGQEQFARAVRISTDAQKALGLSNIAPLPKTTADATVAAFENVDAPQEERVAKLNSVVFATKDPEQQRAIFQQLVKAGLDPITEGALEAGARGDQGAARRLMFAALVDPKKLPGKLAFSDDNIGAEIQKTVMAPGKIGDAVYGLSLGESENAERAIRDDDLMKRAAKMRIARGENLQQAVAGAAKDLYGDKEVFEAKWGLNAKLVVDKGEDTATLRRGLEALMPTVERTAKDYADGVLALSRDRLSAKTGERAVVGAAVPNMTQAVVSEGIWRDNGDGISFWDIYTGSFLKDAKGKVLTFSRDDVVKAAREAKSAPGFWPEAVEDYIGSGL